MSLYNFPGQLADNETCGMDCKSVPRAHYDGVRFQRGFITMTVAAGVLTCAVQTVELFRYGLGEDATGAGYPISGSDPMLFSADDTNVSPKNGLDDCAIIAAGVTIDDPVVLTASSVASKTVLAIGGDAAVDGYRDEILRRVASHFRLDLLRCADTEEEGQTRTFGLGSLRRNLDPQASWKDDQFANTGGVPGLPRGMARRFEIPKVEGTERPFKVQIVNKRAITIPTRATPVTNTLRIPIEVAFEVVPLS